MFIREDWTIFRNLNTLSQKAGVPLKNIRRLVLKEIMDNALDSAPGKKPTVGTFIDGTHYIEDEGPGIPGTPQQIADLFSIRRPLTSTKILRVPSRGALGNGIRVIAGSVIGSGGKLSVHTRGQCIDLNLKDDGTTEVVGTKPSGVKGTRIAIKFGASLPEGSDDWLWANQAAAFNFAKTYQGQTSCWWYDSDTFYELFLAAGDMPLYQLLTKFDGFGLGSRNYKDVLQEVAKDRICGDMTRTGSDDLLDIMRRAAEPISDKKIGMMLSGSLAELKDVPYAREYGTVVVEPGRGKHSARLPFVVEALAGHAKPGVLHPTDDSILVLVNGTPITGETYIDRRGKTEVGIFGCGLKHRFTRVSRQNFFVTLNVTIPYMPITTDGKEPDFTRIIGAVQTVLSKSTRKLKSMALKEGARQTDIIGEHIDEAVKKASGGGMLRFSIRQLYYAVRPFVLERAEEAKLDYTYFCRWISQYENDRGEIKGMYRDPRGTLYHPHTGETIPVGTISVEEYKRPEWTFNKILYIEKEGLFEVLKHVGFPERFDCALLSSKGFASRAVRDLIDLLGDSGEEIHVFAIHDADGPGTSIYEALVEGTLARAARRVKVHNLGIEPWEGVKMGLQIETFDARKQRVPVAKYVKDRHYDEDGDRDREDWADWLQTNRIELNAMTSPQFVQWLEEKFEALEIEKIVPPNKVLERQLRERTEAKVRTAVATHLLREAGYEDKVRVRMTELDERIKFERKLPEIIAQELKKNPTQQWSAPIDKLATKFADGKA